MTARQILDAHFDTVDILLGAIRASEIVLDPLLLPPEEQTLLGALSVMPSSAALSPPLDLDRPEAELARDVAERIRQERKKRGWRQRDLADITGIARPNIARLESGRRMPKITTLYKIGQALKVSVESLLGSP